MLKVAERVVAEDYGPEELGLLAEVTGRTVYADIVRGRLETVIIRGRRRVLHSEAVRYINYRREIPRGDRHGST